MARRVAKEVTLQECDPGFSFPARKFPKLMKLTTPRIHPLLAH